MIKIALALLALAVGASSALAQSPEALKSSNWTGGSWRAQAVVALPAVAPKVVVEDVQFRPAPLPPQPHVRLFTSYYYRWEHEAERAREWKVQELRRMGFHVLSSRLLRDSGGWFYEIRYIRR